MNMRTLSLASLAAFAIAGPASAVVLLTDNYNTNNNTDSTFNNTLGADQGGLLATVSYNIASGAYWQVQHGNGGAMLLTGYSRVSLDHDFSAEANSYDSPITIDFGYLHASSSGWGSFVISGQKPDYIQNSTVIFGELFTGAGGTQLFNGGASPYATGSGFVNDSNIRFVLSNTAGTGSAYNGAGSLLTIYSNNTQINQVTLPQLTSGTYFSFGGGGWDGNPTKFDNLTVSVISEPSAALLGGLGTLVLLRRRR